ncbi:hypothetical protein U0070_011101 [Myodes glareolus]|uniref:Uncharacterized protein n=1 Tax=Myodes glareolus TaxID=447135 RepID=A0AAW0IET7_MYOGA
MTLMGEDALTHFFPELLGEVHCGADSGLGLTLLPRRELSFQPVRKQEDLTHVTTCIDLGDPLREQLTLLDRAVLFTRQRQQMPEGDRTCQPSELVLVAGKSRMVMSPGCWKLWRPSLVLSAEHDPAPLLTHAPSTSADTLTSLFSLLDIMWETKDVVH